MTAVRWIAACFTAIAGAYLGVLTFYAWPLLKLDAFTGVMLTGFVSTTLATVAAVCFAPSYKMVISAAPSAALIAYCLWSTGLEYVSSDLLFIPAVTGIVAAGLLCSIGVRAWQLRDLTARR